LSDLPLPELIAFAKERDAIGTFLCVRPSSSFHVVSLDQDSQVEEIGRASEAGLWINGGFFVFRREIFDHLHAGEELVEAPFTRLRAVRRLFGYTYEGFWVGMDTFKDRQRLDELSAQGRAPWQVWRTDVDP
jgi:glucose-1-phosphate cytidylyltransferase